MGDEIDHIAIRIHQNSFRGLHQKEAHSRPPRGGFRFEGAIDRPTTIGNSTTSALAIQRAMNANVARPPTRSASTYNLVAPRLRLPRDKEWRMGRKLVSIQTI